MVTPDWDAIVPKKEVASVFKRIKGKRENKVCIDCSQQNPTWATIPYGSFLCLDCAGVHRSLGVHITFVRSTNMDEWTWGQLRNMQVGGNPRALAQYSKQGLTTPDISEKYVSNVAKSYKTKLENEAKKLHAKLGSNLFEVEGGEAGGDADADFFDTAAESANTSVADPGTRLAGASAAPAVDPGSKLTSSLAGSGAGESAAPAPKKKLLLKKKTGVGAKAKAKVGGLGAIKKVVKKGNFDEMEANINAEDEERAKVAPAEVEAATSGASMTKRLEKFAIKTTSRDMTKMDEMKLEQAERLGMGLSRTTTNANVFSHSTSSAMQEVTQESDSKGSSSTLDSASRGGYLDREPRSTLEPKDDFFKSYGK